MGLLPRVIHGGYPAPIPGDWLTPKEPSQLFYTQDLVDIYVNGQIVERPCLVFLDDMPCDTGEMVPPHVSADYPDGGPQVVIEGNVLALRQQWRPVDLFGFVEVRRRLPDFIRRGELDALYVEEYGWSVGPYGRVLKPKRRARPS